MVYRFHDCELDADRRELTRAGAPCAVEPKVFDLLLFLIDNRGRFVSKNELIETIWDGRIVSDAALSRCIKQARQAIGDDGRRQEFIKTVTRRGFRFAGEIEETGVAAPAEIEEAPPSFVWPEKPSIVVLPFDNLTGDPAQEFLCDGLTENVIAVLSNTPYLNVVARNSAFTYKNRPVQVQTIARELGVRFVLEGSIKRSGDTMRITAQLVDASTGHHIWAERYDRKLDNFFKLEDEITFGILEEICVRLISGELARRWRHVANSIEEFNDIAQGRAYFQERSPEGHEMATRYWSRVYERDPERPIGNILLAWLHCQKVSMLISEDRAVDLAIARNYAETAIRINPDEYRKPHSLIGHIDLFELRYEDAIATVDQGIALKPRDPEALSHGGFVKSAAGQHRDGIAAMERSIRLEPYFLEWVPIEISRANMQLGEFDAARNICRATLAKKLRNPGLQMIATCQLAAMGVFEGDLPTARDHMRYVLQNFKSIRQSVVMAASYFRRDQDFQRRYVEALGKAGLPK